MDISILAPSGVKFAMGGAEHLWLGLQQYLNEETKHNCELFKFPSPGGSLNEILQSYLFPVNYDLNHFDQMITGKDPAWFGSHDDHRIYMLHKLRGLYDTYHIFQEPYSEELHSTAAAEALNHLQFLASTGGSIDQARRTIERLILSIERQEIDEHELRFPGPFSRNIVHAIDAIALNPSRISRYAAISRTVGNRPGYFPEGISAEVIYPPPRLDGFRCGPAEHFFTVSRLDSPKRIDRIISEFLALQADVNLFIGGEGPELENLKKVANNDRRIIFLGKMTDGEILDYYSRSIAVPFVPYDEDYGLITVEAMRSGKPVITLQDCGGVTELVRHGENGWCMPNELGALTSAFEQALANNNRTAEMGKIGENSVQEITWRNVARKLIDADRKPHKYIAVNTAHREEIKRPRIIVTSTFGIYPPRGGGQSRVYHLYSKLAEYYDILAICLVSSDETFEDRIIAPNFREVRVPKSAEHEFAEIELSKTIEWVPITDIVASELIHLTPRFSECLLDYGTSAAALVLSGPYLYDAVRNVLPKIQIFYEAHNFELELKRVILPNTAAGNEKLETVYRLESRSWQDASLVFACSARDLDMLQDEFGWSNAVKIEVPNGFSPIETNFIEPILRRQLASSIDVRMKRSAIFLGSWHGPNLSAIQKIISLAENFRDVTFMIVGSGCLAFTDHNIPCNVRMLGVVDDHEKSILLGSASVALNPMTEGSGSNLKMLDYFAAGVPVISTLFGARGIEAESGVHYISADIDRFSIALSEFFVNAKSYDEIVYNARALADRKYRWDVIGETLLGAISEFISPLKDARH